LLLFWRVDRQGWFEAPGFATLAEQEQFRQLKERAALSPDDPQLQIQAIDFLRRGGAQQKANYLLKKYLTGHPNSAVAYLELAILNSAGKQQVPKKTAADAQKALQLGLNTPQQKALANELIGRYQLNSGTIEEAINSFSQAIAFSSKRSSDQIAAQEDTRLLIQLYILRSQAYRRQSQFDNAYQDVKQAGKYALLSGNKMALNQIQGEIETLEKHAGRNFAPISANFP
jgi:tetratricopeptide (TPR) repeat protein